MYFLERDGGQYHEALFPRKIPFSCVVDMHRFVINSFVAVCPLYESFDKLVVLFLN
jgi:hypothetical protein